RRVGGRDVREIAADDHPLEQFTAAVIGHQFVHIHLPPTDDAPSAAPAGSSGAWARVALVPRLRLAPDVPLSDEHELIRRHASPTEPMARTATLTLQTQPLRLKTSRATSQWMSIAALLPISGRDRTAPPGTEDGPGPLSAPLPPRAA